MRKRIITALAVALVACGCATEHFAMDAKHPAAVMREDGLLVFRDRAMTAEKLPRALKRAGIPRDREINVRVPDSVSNPGTLRHIRGILGKAGYRRVIFVSQVRAKSYQKDGRDPMLEYAPHPPRGNRP